MSESEWCLLWLWIRLRITNWRRSCSVRTQLLSVLGFLIPRSLSATCKMIWLVTRCLYVYNNRSGHVRLGQVFVVQLLLATDAATNSLHCSLSSAISLDIIHCLSAIFLKFDTPALLRSCSRQSVHLFHGLPVDLLPLVCCTFYVLSLLHRLYVYIYLHISW